MIKFGSDPNTGGLRDIDSDQGMFGGALIALSPNMPRLLPALLAPQVICGMLFNAYLLVSYLTGRITLADIAVFYFFEIGLYMALYVPMICLNILGDAKKNWRLKKDALNELFYWTFAGIFFPVVLFESYTHPITGFHEQLFLVMGKLKLGLLPFALQFCLGAFYFLTRPKHKYAYQAALFPFGWYVAGQFSVLPFLFFIAVPGYFLTDSYAPGVTAFLLLRINNEVGPQLAAMKFEEDVDWNLRQGADNAQTAPAVFLKPRK